MTSASSKAAHFLLPDLYFLTISASFPVANSSSFFTACSFGGGTSSSSALRFEVGGVSGSRGMSCWATSFKP